MRTISVFGDKYNSFAVGRRFDANRATLHQTTVPQRVTTLQIVRLLDSSHKHSYLLNWQTEMNES